MSEIINKEINWEHDIKNKIFVKYLIKDSMFKTYFDSNEFINCKIINSKFSDNRMKLFKIISSKVGHCDFRDCEFMISELCNSNFYRCKFTGSKFDVFGGFYSSRLKECNFGYKIQYPYDTSFETRTNTFNFETTHFEKCNFRNLLFKNCKFDGAVFKNCYFKGAKFINCKFINTQFINCEGLDKDTLTLLDGCGAFIYDNKFDLLSYCKVSTELFIASIFVNDEWKQYKAFKTEDDAISYCVNNSNSENEITAEGFNYKVPLEFIKDGKLYFITQTLYGDSHNLMSYDSWIKSDTYKGYKHFVELPE